MPQYTTDIMIEAHEKSGKTLFIGEKVIKTSDDLHSELLRDLCDVHHRWQVQ